MIIYAKYRYAQKQYKHKIEGNDFYCFKMGLLYLTQTLKACNDMV